MDPYACTNVEPIFIKFMWISLHQNYGYSRLKMIAVVSCDFVLDSSATSVDSLEDEIFFFQ
jgi:hypothetical protein